MTSLLLWLTIIVTVAVGYIVAPRFKSGLLAAVAAVAIAYAAQVLLAIFGALIFAHPLQDPDSLSLQDHIVLIAFLAIAAVAVRRFVAPSRR